MSSTATAEDTVSIRIDTTSRNFDMRASSAGIAPPTIKPSTMQVSKAFRCTMPGMRDDQADNLRRWAELHCAQSAVFRDDRGSVVLVGLKDELRSSASFARTVRTALSRMSINAPLRGRWCTLITAREVLAVVSDGATAGGRRGAGTDSCAADPAEDDGDARVVALRQHRDVLRRKLPLTEK